jgi:hypothetical protein
MWKFSIVSINLPFVVVQIIFIMFSIGPMACPLFNRCCANFDFSILYLKSRKRSLNRVLKDLPVCPMYFIWQLGQVNWYTPLLLNLSSAGFGLGANSFLIVCFVVQVILTGVSLNSLVINLVSLPT